MKPQPQGMNYEVGHRLHFVLIKKSIDCKLPILDDDSPSAGSVLRMIEPVDGESILINVLFKKASKGTSRIIIYAE